MNASDRLMPDKYIYHYSKTVKNEFASVLVSCDNFPFVYSYLFLIIFVLGLNTTVLSNNFQILPVVQISQGILGKL